MAALQEQSTQKGYAEVSRMLEANRDVMVKALTSRFEQIFIKFFVDRKQETLSPTDFAAFLSEIERQTVGVVQVFRDQINNRLAANGVVDVDLLVSARVTEFFRSITRTVLYGADNKLSPTTSIIGKFGGGRLMVETDGGRLPLTTLNIHRYVEERIGLQLAIAAGADDAQLGELIRQVESTEVIAKSAEAKKHFENSVVFSSSNSPQQNKERLIALRTVTALSRAPLTPDAIRVLAALQPDEAEFNSDSLQLLRNRVTGFDEVVGGQTRYSAPERLEDYEAQELQTLLTLLDKHMAALRSNRKVKQLQSLGLDAAALLGILTSVRSEIAEILRLNEQIGTIDQTDARFLAWKRHADNVHVGAHAINTYIENLRQESIRTDGFANLDPTVARARAADVREAQSRLTAFLNNTSPEDLSPEEFAARQAYINFLSNQLAEFVGQLEAVGGGARVEGRRVQPPNSPGSLRTNELGDPKPEAQVSLQIDRLHRHFIKHFNPRLPAMDALLALQPENAKNFSEKFFLELELAILKHWENVFNKTTGGASKPYPRPNESVNLWEDEIKVEITDETGTTHVMVKLMDYFKELPWEKLYPNITFEQKNDVIDFWMMRILHVQFMHNYCYQIESKRASWQQASFPHDIVEEINKKGDSGGFFKADLTAYYTTQYNKNPELSALLGQDRGWRLLANLTDYFLFRIRRDNPNFTAFIPGTTDSLTRNKEKFIDSIPSSFRIKDEHGAYRDQLIIESAWTIACWQMYPTLQVFSLNPDGLTSKLERAFFPILYGAKVGYGMTNTDEIYCRTAAEQLNRSILPRTEYIHYFAELSPHMYDETTFDELVAERDRYRTLSTSNVEARSRAEALTRYLINLVSIAVGDGEDDPDQYGAAVTKRYKLLKIKPEYCNLHLDAGLPIAVTRKKMVYLEELARSNPAVRNLIPLSESQLVDSTLDRNYIRFDTITQNHGERWAQAMTDGMFWYDGLDVRNGKGGEKIFPDIHTLDHLIKKRTSIIGLHEAIALRFEGVLPGLVSKQRAIATSERLMKLIHIRHVEGEELAKREGGLHFAAVNKAGARYFSDKLLVCGPELPGIGTLTDFDILLQLFRRQWAGDEDYPDMRHLQQTKDKTLIRERSRTVVQPGVRALVDIAWEHRRNSATGKLEFINETKAKNQFLVEAFMIAVRMYLDRYSYKSIENGHGVSPGMSIDKARADIHTESGFEPMTFAHRKLFLAFVEAQLHEYAHGPEYGGGDPDKVAFSIPTIDVVRQIFFDIGIEGSYEQYIVDVHYLLNGYKNLGKASDDGKKKAH